MTGRTLADRYELVERRGTGGMAEVWEAIDHNLGRRVAVKMLHSHLAAEASVLDRFRSEAQAAARLTHPGIVAIFDTVTTDSTDAIIMELVAGRDLRSILDERPTLAMADAVEVGVQLAAALGHAHQHGIIHRDLKPANILVRPDRRVKLSDFGIAKALDATSHTESGSLVGTVKYLAPEQIEGHPVDARTDLYGLTTVLYEMLCGEVPFAASDLIGAMNRIRKAPPSARKLRPDLPPALDEFLQRGLARNPADRYPDASTWSAQLTAAVQGKTTADGETIDPTVAEVARPRPTPGLAPAVRPASIPMRPAPSTPQQPVTGPGPRAARPAQRRSPAPVVEAPTPEPVAKHVKPKRRVMAWLGPVIAMALAIATVATVWFLLRPASTAVTDRFGDEDNTELSSSTSTPETSDTDTETGSDSGEVITDDSVGDTETTTTDVAATTGDDTTNDEQAAETTSSTTTSTTTTTLPEFSNGIRSVAFDPLGDNAERNETASLALDSDPTTFWLTETYKTRGLGQLKEGVGLIVELETPRDVAQLRVLTDRVDWSVSIYEADAPAATIDGWNAPLAEFSGLGQDEVLDIPDTPSVTAMLVWITDLGLAPDQTVEDYDAQVESGENAQRLQIFELELIG